MRKLKKMKETKKKGCEYGKWAEICCDLLEKIVECIHSYSDHVRFRAVCKNWYLKIPKYGKHMQLPLLLLPFKNEHDILRPLYDPVERRVSGYLPLPETKGMVFCGCSYKWLIMIGIEGEVKMLEPFTRVQMDLPPVSTFPGVEYNPNKGVEYTVKQRDGLILSVDRLKMQNNYVRKIILSTPPDGEDGDFMAIAIYGNDFRLCYFKPGDMRWVEFPKSQEDNQEVECLDAVFHCGKIYVLNLCCWIYEYDMKTILQGLTRMPPIEFFHIWGPTYLTVGSNGCFRIVAQRAKDGVYSAIKGTDHVTDKFFFSELNESENGKSCWLPVQSLEDEIIVIGLNSSVSIPSRSTPHKKGKYIFFSDSPPEIDLGADLCATVTDSGVFNLEDDSISFFEKEPIEDFAPQKIIKLPPIWLI